MVEFQIFLEGLMGTLGQFLKDFLTSVGGVVGGIGAGVRDLLAGINLSK